MSARYVHTIRPEDIEPLRCRVCHSTQIAQTLKLEAVPDEPGLAHLSTGCHLCGSYGVESVYWPAPEAEG